MNGTVCIVGCGDIGARVARLVRDTRVIGVVSSAGSARRLQDLGVDARAADLDQSAPLVRGTVLWFAPPPGAGNEDTRIARFVERGPRVERMVYLSTSGVYGDCGGAWIDETAPIAPRTDRARRRAHAEAVLRQWADADGCDLRILRVPGIYGPGRLPRPRLEKGLPLLRPEDSPWTNRIHADDLARAALAVLHNGRPGRVYHVADGHPTTMTDYFLRCAELLGLPPPPLLPVEEARAAMSEAMWSFMEENKRLRVDRLRDEIGFQWLYPDLQSGLAAMAEVGSEKKEG